jgi:hypothetical protein
MDYHKTSTRHKIFEYRARPAHRRLNDRPGEGPSPRSAWARPPVTCGFPKPVGLRRGRHCARRRLPSARRAGVSQHELLPEPEVDALVPVTGGPLPRPAPRGAGRACRPGAREQVLVAPGTSPLPPSAAPARRTTQILKLSLTWRRYAPAVQSRSDQDGVQGRPCRCAGPAKLGGTAWPCWGRRGTGAGRDSTARLPASWRISQQRQAKDLVRAS